MLIRNVDDILVNGLVGKVIGFYRPWELEVAVQECDVSCSGSGPKPDRAGYLCHVALEPETGRPQLRQGSNWNGQAKTLDRFPLVLFEYNKHTDNQDRYENEAVLIEWEEFHLDDAEGKSLACRIQM